MRLTGGRMKQGDGRRKGSLEWHFPSTLPCSLYGPEAADQGKKK